MGDNAINTTEKMQELHGLWLALERLFQGHSPPVFPFVVIKDGKEIIKFDRAEGSKECRIRIKPRNRSVWCALPQWTQEDKINYSAHAKDLFAKFHETVDLFENKIDLAIKNLSGFGEEPEDGDGIDVLIKTSYAEDVPIPEEASEIVACLEEQEENSPVFEESHAPVIDRGSEDDLPERHESAPAEEGH